jgi:hypothetical protein
LIESASFPADLATWDEAAQPYYFELYGETQPVLNMSYGEVIPPGFDSAQQVNPTPVYEYWWTVGHGGHGPLHHHLFDDHAHEPIWESLADPAGRVYLYFPIHGGWRVKELVATVKYLNPALDQKTWTAKIADELKSLEPAAATVGAAVAPVLSPVPVAGPLIAGSSPYLSALAKMKADSVPPDAKGFAWHVTKVAFGSPGRGGVMQGVSWVLPRAMFKSLGSRLTGSLAVSFMPCHPQAAGAGADGGTDGVGGVDGEDVRRDWRPRALPALAHAVVYANGKEHWAPAINEFVELRISPRTP